MPVNKKINETIRHFRKEENIKWSKTTVKSVKQPYHQENANLNYLEIHPHPVRWLSSRNLTAEARELAQRGKNIDCSSTRPRVRS